MTAVCRLLVFALQLATADPSVIEEFRIARPRLTTFRLLQSTIVDPCCRLLVVRGTASGLEQAWQGDRWWWGAGETVGVFLRSVDDAARVSTLALLESTDGDSELLSLRPDRDSVRLARVGTYYGRRIPWVKVFFDVGARRHLRTAWYYPPPIAEAVTVGSELYLVANAGDRLLVARAADPPRLATAPEFRAAMARVPALAAQIERQKLESSPALPSLSFSHRSALTSAALPAPYSFSRDRERIVGIEEQTPSGTRLYRLPRSNWNDFARARPKRVQDGYHREGTKIAEYIGPHAVSGDRVWFSKTFYDGEGDTGVGGLGYFDLTERKYVLAPIPEIRDWSGSALHREGDAIWVGLARWGEGAATFGGLLRYELVAPHVRVYAVRDLILRIVRHDGTLYAGTENGFYTLRGEVLEHYVFEPAASGDFELRRETITQVH